MVDSPPYACQLVLVANETAVLNARSGATAPKPCGFHGSRPCARCMTYSTRIDTPANNSTAIAYSVQCISRCSSTPHTR